MSNSRVLPHAEVVKEGDLNIAKIPVSSHNPSDQKDVALRRFAADWLRQNVKDTAVDTRFEKVQGLSWYDEATKAETPLVAFLVLTWWPRPPMTEYEMLLASQRARRREASS